MKKLIPLLALVIFCVSVHAQKKKNKGEEPSAEQINKIVSEQLNSSVFLTEAAKRSCLCIDSIDVKNKNHKEISTLISECIDKQATSYQMGAKLFSSLVSSEKNNKIEINQNKNSSEYKQYYYDIERWLNDSCKSFKTTAASNNKESEFSISQNADAIDAYNKGIDYMKKENFKEAIIFFEKAVNFDDKFAFGWDNLGICNRKTGNYEAALNAYKKSMEIDPKGKTPLQNIPVVYVYLKDFDKAIEAYIRLGNVYPGDPEIFYGIGKIYTYDKPDMEKALRNLCKAYNLYVEIQSPYRTDAENLISYVYGQMKKDGKEDLFYKILKEYNISPDKK